jgi:CRISPR/Cas system-associated protein Cas7 (RAMP superfamily)
MIGGPKLSSFKIGGSKLQKIENRRIKTAIKALIYFLSIQTQNC